MNVAAERGTFCLVLHTHLPWLARAGTWPVGEEWLYQAWAQSYLPVVSLLRRLGDAGRRDVLTLGVTPVVAAQLDDPYCLRQFHQWLGDWQVRASGLAPRLPAAAAYEFASATHALREFETRWQHGAAPVLRELVDADVVELLGGPLTHPFQPLLDDAIARFALHSGLDDALLRLGRRTPGIWAPECAYRPGLESLYADADVSHFMLDGPTLIGGRRDSVQPSRRLHDPDATADAWFVGDSDVIAFGRDLSVSYLVWSPRRGYPGGRHYRDFHTFDHPSGFRVARVTSVQTEPDAKRPYEPERAAHAVRADAAHFVDAVWTRLDDLAARRDGRAGLVVCAYDTELFGHWWHEGPQFLELVLHRLPEVGVRVTTLRGALETHAAAGRVYPGPGSWGSGKDWHVWDGELVADVAAESGRVQKELLDVVSTLAPRRARRPDLDQLCREGLLALASDWAFMVTKDAAPDYARRRFADHVARFRRLTSAIGAGRGHEVAAELAVFDGPFGHLDARNLWHDRSSCAR